MCPASPPRRWATGTASLYALRKLLERWSRLARDQGRSSPDLAHIVRFKIAELSAYESVLRQAQDRRVPWQSLKLAEAPVGYDYFDQRDDRWTNVVLPP